jgi:hypothetical protein
MELPQVHLLVPTLVRLHWDELPPDADGPVSVAWLVATPLHSPLRPLALTSFVHDDGEPSH